jgi:hypothetical protein
MDKNDVKQKFLTVYDYGTGGVWQFVHARNKEEILDKFTKLQIVDVIPGWMDEKEIKRTRSYDIDEPPDEYLTRFLKVKN